MTHLIITDHSRIFNNFTYIYPVVSRRSEGMSLGINLNVNNACNWRCVYCQVDGLVRGKPETIDLEKLSYELDYMINYIVNGDFLDKYTSTKFRRFNDICLSGNGESTSSHDFLAVVNIIASLREKYKLTNDVKTILISNGSEIDRNDISKALQILSTLNGEVWFKVDSATKSGINKINQVILSIDGVKKRLLLSTKLCKTYIQTCMYKTSGIDPDTNEVDAYINFVNSVREHIAGVLLYSTARKTALPEGHDISSVSEEFLANISNRLSTNGILVKYYH